MEPGFPDCTDGPEMEVGTTASANNARMTLDLNRGCAGYDFARERWVRRRKLIMAAPDEYALAGWGQGLPLYRKTGPFEGETHARRPGPGAVNRGHSGKQRTTGPLCQGHHAEWMPDTCWAEGRVARILQQKHDAPAEVKRLGSAAES